MSLKLKLQDVNREKGRKDTGLWSGMDLQETGCNPDSATEKSSMSSGIRERR